MKVWALLICGVLAAVRGVSAQDSANCVACRDAELSYCFYTAGTEGDVVIGVCAKGITEQAGCPSFPALSAMYNDILASSDITPSGFAQYDATTMDCTSASLGDTGAVLLPMASGVEVETQSIASREECLASYHGWCNYEPTGSAEGGYCGAAASEKCGVLADFEATALTPSNSGDPVLPNPCTDCTADSDFCGYYSSGTDEIAYVVCLPTTTPARTDCPSVAALDDMYISIGLQASDLTKILVNSANAATECPAFENMSQELIMSVTSSISDEVITTATCEECVSSAMWCNYVPTKTSTTGNEEEGGYCGADSSCVTLADKEGYSFTMTGPLDECSAVGSSTTTAPLTTPSPAVTSYDQKGLLMIVGGSVFALLFTLH